VFLYLRQRATPARVSSRRATAPSATQRMVLLREALTVVVVTFSEDTVGAGTATASIALLMAVRARVLLSLYPRGDGGTKTMHETTLTEWPSPPPPLLLLFPLLPLSLWGMRAR